MNYVSTRGEAPELGFRDVLLTGLARDGGLYIPQAWPRLKADEIAQMRGQRYAQVAKTVLYPFVEGEIDFTDFAAMVDEAYGSFNHKAVVPLVQIDHNHWLMELYHGPTLAFKDVAMQLLSRLMDHVLAQKGDRATIIGATSGDTGSAAIEAFKGRENTDIFILFPKGKVSPVQQRQMTTVPDKNVHCLAVEGDFDDCQALVKEMFNHLEFRDRLKLSGVNSINWARIMAQIVYYFTTAANLGAPERSVSFTVPTGNFGDIFAGYVAKQMGLPIDKLIIATNRNDILARTLASGNYQKAKTEPSISPSMDIQVSSNFERLLFDASERNAQTVRNQMESLKQSGSFSIAEDAMNRIYKDFDARACSEEETKQQIQKTIAETGYLADPHTAVGLHVAEQFLSESSAMVTLATAHPAKFPVAVENASGIFPNLPQHMADLMERDERMTVLPNDCAAIEAFIETNARINS